MVQDSSSTRTSSRIGIITLLGSALLRVLGILLNVPVLSWLALAFALTGMAISVARLIQGHRRSRSRLQ